MDGNTLTHSLEAIKTGRNENISRMKVDRREKRLPSECTDGCVELAEDDGEVT